MGKISSLLNSLLLLNSSYDKTSVRYASEVSVVEQDIVPPKVKPAIKVPPVYLGSAKGTTIQNVAANTTNLDLASFRTARSMNEVIKSLVRVSPDLSQAVVTKISAAISDTYMAYACTLDGQIDEKATSLLHALLARMNNLSPDFTKFSRSTDLRSLSESLLMDDIRYGAISCELVLTKARMPSHIRHVPSRVLEWKEKGGDVIPIIKINGEDVELDYPTLFYISSFQDGESPYADSQIEAAIQPVLFEEEFKGDLRRAVRNVILPRLKVVINTDEWRKTLPMEIQQDEKRLRDYMSETISGLETTINGLNPEDALVVFDILDPSYMTHGNISTDRDIKVLQSLLSGNVASGAKTLPAVLGKSETQGAGSAESMIFMKGVEASQERLNTIFSRIFTLSLRLYGLEVFAKFSFSDVNLRPKDELEAFYSMKQSRVMEQLSYGFITDHEAGIALTGHLPPVGFTPLSGTQFSVNKTNVENPFSNTSVKPGNVDDSTAGKARKPGSPQQPKS